MNKEILASIKKQAEGAVKKVNSTEEIQNLRVEFLGRKSQLALGLRSLKEMSEEERRELGPLANGLRVELEEKFSQKEKELAGASESEAIDITIPGKKPEIGHMHILSQVQKQIEDIFNSMGFEIADGPELENEWFNFDALNMPKNHPARDMQDTFWTKDIDKEGFKLLPRTQTSNGQIHHLKNHKPPFRVIVPGKVFRNEATDANHEHTFFQFEALVVGKDISVANFKDIGKKFFSQFFGTEVNIRLRPSYFPFTEPSFEFDISCTICGGDGCSACKGGGWLEIGGAGMVNQRVFEACGYGRNEWQGFAWGFGINRLAMMKYKIDDIRLFMGSDLRFIKQF